jgi:hypothetical protein
MCETTSAEFVEWQYYFDIEANTPRKEDYYLAQIAAEVRRTVVKNPKSIHTDQFLLKFQRAENRKELTEEERLQEIENSKAQWTAIANLPFRTKPVKKCVK